MPSNDFSFIQGITFNLLITGSNQEAPGTRSSGSDPLPLHFLHVQARVHNSAPDFIPDLEDPGPKLGK